MTQKLIAYYLAKAFVVGLDVLVFYYWPLVGFALVAWSAIRLTPTEATDEKADQDDN